VSALLLNRTRPATGVSVLLLDPIIVVESLGFVTIDSHVVDVLYHGGHSAR